MAGGVLLGAVGPQAFQRRESGSFFRVRSPFLEKGDGGDLPAIDRKVFVRTHKPLLRRIE
jgi:hypothetical protein